MKRKELKTGDYGSQRIVENAPKPKPVDPTKWPEASMLDPARKAEKKQSSYLTFEQQQLRALERIVDSLEKLTNILESK